MRSADLVKTLDNSVKISKTIVDEQHNLDAFLISAIGLADVGNDVLGANRKGVDERLPPTGADYRSAQRVRPGADVHLRW